MNIAKIIRNNFKIVNILFALALFVRIAIPQGYMVNNSQTDGLFPIVLCSAQGNIEAYIDNNGNIIDKAEKHKDDSHEKQSHCAFAGALNSFTHTPEILADVTLSETDKIRIIPIYNIGIGYGLAAPPPPSTGPPLNT